MVNGQFKCLGSTQHLKSKFGKGFVLTVKIKRKATSSNNNGEMIRSESDEMFEERNIVKEFITDEFEGAVLK